ncbi:MAG: AmmeMemoRadiSam system radical SAM enzyme [Methylocystaceae bacterium]
MTGHQAEFFAVDNERVVCHLCPHNCHLRPDQIGTCRVRFNHEGSLKTMTYGQVSALALDPIEKKPLYHFYPGAQILSAGSFGCNLGCPWCQNHHIACAVPPTRYLEPGEMVNMALDAVTEGSVGLAYTYNEPTMAFEFVLACAHNARTHGLKNVLVTNGYVNTEPLLSLLEVTDALNIDLKGFTPEFYRHYCKGSLEPVWDSILLAASQSHVEITTLVIPGLNDNPDEFREAARRLSEISKDIPWHLSAFYPAHRFLDRSPTPAQTLIELRAIAREYLHFVYLGNLGQVANDTSCPHCGTVLIKRPEYRGSIVGIKDNSCRSCGTPVAVIC